MKSLSIVVLLSVASCSRHNNFYQGVVTDTAGNALAGVRVVEMYRENQTLTDENGYFKVSRSPDWISDLIFSKAGFRTDTLPTVWHQHGETTEWNFVTDDTTKVKLWLDGGNNSEVAKPQSKNTNSGLLQYLEEGENEDNLYSLFLTKDLDTLRIVLPQDGYLDSSAAGKMYNAIWEYRLMTSGGDSEVKYQQAFMRKYNEIKAKRFR